MELNTIFIILAMAILLNHKLKSFFTNVKAANNLAISIGSYLSMFTIMAFFIALYGYLMNYFFNIEYTLLNSIYGYTGMIYLIEFIKYVLQFFGNKNDTIENN